MDPDGSNLETWLPVQTALAYGAIDVDAQDRRVYWSAFRGLGSGGTFANDAGPFPPPTAVARANPNGGQIEDVFETGDVQHVFVDGVSDKIFYDSGSDCTPCTSITRRNLDGSNPIGIVGKINFTPFAADPVGQKVYWNASGAIQVANYDGSGQQTLVSDVGSSWSMAIDKLPTSVPL